MGKVITPKLETWLERKKSAFKRMAINKRGLLLIFSLSVSLYLLVSVFEYFIYVYTRELT